MMCRLFRVFSSLIFNKYKNIISFNIMTEGHKKCLILKKFSDICILDNFSRLVFLFGPLTLGCINKIAKI